MNVRRGFSGLLIVGLVGAIFPGTATAGADTTCDYDPVSAKVTITILEGYARVRRAGAIIEYTGVGVAGYQPCDGATVRNTDKVVLVDQSQGLDRYFAIDQSHGRFEPGKTDEPNGRDEIEFVADYAGDDMESMFVTVGTHGDDRTIAGDEGVKLNRDDDLDVQLSDVGFVDLEGLRGADVLSLVGGEGTGGPVGPGRFFGNGLSGGRGDDELLGGPGMNTIVGGDGGDVLRGGPGADSLQGIEGNDRIFAGPGDDSYVLGGEGNDHLEGSRGDDWLRGNGGDDHLDGDRGTDTCEGGAGANSFEDCEKP